MDGPARLFCRILGCVLVPAASLSPATPASAQAEVKVTAKGTVAPSCSMSATQQFGSQNLNVAGIATARAQINCNQFFKINATSQNGAIKSSVAIASPFTNTLSYTLKADVALDDGSIRSATCASQQLVAGQTSCALSPANGAGLTSNGQIATNRTTTLTISWTPPASPNFLKPGSYSDSITLTIAAVP
jgi:hypothetical protein